MSGTTDSSKAPPNRSLLLVPIVHTPEDLGGLGDSVRNDYVRRRGRAQWKAHLKSIDALWTQIRLMVDGLGFDWPHVRLYQDGLPVCDHEGTIVRELAEKGSANHRLLVDLIDRGAQLTGTESPQLLIQEYELSRQILGDPQSARRSTKPEIERQARQLLDQRDQFIASRIAQTLQTHEQGLIFLGMLHALSGHLPGDISLAVLRPGDRPPLAPNRAR